MLPKRIETDLEEVPADARARLEFVFLERVENAVACAIGELPAAQRAGAALRTVATPCRAAVRGKAV